MSATVRMPRSPSVAANQGTRPIQAGSGRNGIKGPLDSKFGDSHGEKDASSSTTLGLLRLEWELLTLSTAVKLLLWPTYHSTDFEVHRNWLAITRTLSIRDWYFEATSHWTLDYPPFFAYFSYILAQPAPLVDPLIASLHQGLEYAAWSCKAYMRATVVVTELVLAAALLAHSRLGSQRAIKIGYAQEVSNTGATTSQLLAASLLMHPGLIIIDHIHFQYNGFLFGVLAWSLWAAREDRPLLCAFLFSSLLNLKHIYVYVAPPFFIFLLRSYVFPVGSTTGDLGRSVEKLITVGVVTLMPFVLSLAPLAIDGLRHQAGPFGVLSQMVSRLFPFSRGLIHAYWAPNAWALWTFADRLLVKLLPRIPAIRVLLPASFLARYQASASTGFASASRGLVENISFGVLPEISPWTCFLLTLTSMSIYMVKLWQKPTYRSFLASVSLCGFASFLFGWHVHEKAIMLPLIPYTFLAADDYWHLRTFVLLSTAGTVSLFPLLFTPQEGPIKIGYSIVWALLVFGTLQKRLFRPVQSNLGILVHRLETVYLWGFVALQAYVSVVHPLVFASRSGQDVGAVANIPHGLDTASLVQSADVPSIAELATASIIEAVAGSIDDRAVPITDVATEEDALPAEDTIAPDTTAEFDAPQTAVTLADLLSIPATPEARETDAAVEKEQKRSASPTEPASSSWMEFLPLMMVSVYCSIGVIWAWIRASTLYLLSES